MKALIYLVWGGGVSGSPSTQPESPAHSSDGPSLCFQGGLHLTCWQKFCLTAAKISNSPVPETGQHRTRKCLV